MPGPEKVNEFKFDIVDNKATEQVITRLRQILEQSGKSFMLEEVIFFIRELLTNANKANLKKVHFLVNGLDIYNAEHYKKGMESFVKDFHEKLQEYQDHIRQDSFYTRVQLEEEEEVLVVKVRNSGELTRQETSRIDNLIEKSRAIRDIAQAYMMLADDSEGAGLGTISIMLMLRSLGLDESMYSFFSDPIRKETIFAIKVPYNSVTVKQAEEISDLIFKEIDTLPVFPENLAQLQKLLSNPEVHLQDVAQVIEKDFTLSTEILKIVNSAQYMLPNKVSSINNAVSLMGIKGLNNLLFSVGAQKAMDKKYGRLEPLWEHSYRCASYAYNIAKKFKMAAKADDAYIGGILHDVGKILVSHLFPHLLDTINKHCRDKGYGNTLMENLAIGGAHDKIGEEITRRWNFPEIITDMIGYHHKPLLASEENQDLVDIVYLANILSHVHDREFLFAAMEPSIQEKFQLKSEADALALEDFLNTSYKKQQLKQ